MRTHFLAGMLMTLCLFFILLLNACQRNGALTDYNKAIELDPNDANAYYSRGFSYNNSGKYELAIADYSKAIELDPKDAVAYNDRGISYDSLSKYDLAIADYNKAIELDPQNADAYNSLAFLYVTAKNKKHIDGKKAVKLAQKAVELSKGQDPAPIDTLGAAYAKLGQFDKAIEAQSKAISILEQKGEQSEADNYRKVLEDYQEGRTHY